MRENGYLPIRDYAVVGDGRTAALVGRDGSVDWLCLPSLDSESVFGAILDPERGGRFALEPDEPYEAERRYLPGTNVLETTFRAAGGAVRVTDAMTVPGEGLSAAPELVRAVEGLSGTVPMRWAVEPRFRYGRERPVFRRGGSVPVASNGFDAVAIATWDAGSVEHGDGAVRGRFEARDGSRALLSLCSAHQEPLVLPARRDVEQRLEATVRFWESWTARRGYTGPYRDEVARSALALKLLVYAPSGAVAAAPTTSLPETLGGSRNWDYRYCWIRDSAFTLDALLDVGCPDEAHSFFWWLMQASQLTDPRLHVLYRLDGGDRARERVLPLAGYARSTPVRVGNRAIEQSQLDIYGDLFETVWTYVDYGSRLDADAGRRLARMADLVSRIWRERDAGIWEVRSRPLHFTHSKVMCWVALDRACKLAAADAIPSDHAARWRREADAIRDFVERECWSEAKRSYVRFAGADELDAAVLLAPIMGYAGRDGDRLDRTIDAIRHELGGGSPLLFRYTGEDGLAGAEGVFLACSFWLVDALARRGRVDEAREAMEEVLALANDVGLYAEEIEPASGAFLGNFPQGLTHLALILAAVSIARAETEASGT